MIVSAGYDINFIVITGRRGVGKTRLLFEFSRQNNINMVYLFVEKKEIDTLLTKFVNRLEKVIHKKIPKVKTIEDFLVLLENMSATQSLLIVFDEFQNFRYCNKAIFSRFQEFVDRMKYKDTAKMMVVVIGSMIGMLREIFESEESPLYGRKTSEIFLKPFEFWEIRSLLKEIGLTSEEEIIEVYSMLGGMPRYYDNIDRLSLKINRNTVIEFFTTRTYPGWKEVRNELIEEFKDAHITYFSILEAISMGNTTSNEISGYTGILEKSIHKYLNELTNYFQIIEKRIPALAPKTYRGARYYITDPFYRFWFRYIFPNIDLIEIEQSKQLQNEIKKDLPNHVAGIFEEIVRRTLLKISGRRINGIEIPIVNQVCNWWDRKGNEVDIVGVWRKKVQLIGEIKWKNKPFNYSDLEKFIRKLELLKAKNVLIIIVSKEGFTPSAKSYIEEKNGLALTLKQLTRIWNMIETPEKNLGTQ